MQDDNQERTQPHGPHLYDCRAGHSIPNTLGQILAIGVLSFPITGIWALLFLLFLLPIPAPLRFYFESRAYAIDVLTARYRERELVLDKSVEHFGSWDYYLMFPFKDMARNTINYWVEKAEKGEDKILLKVLLLYEMVADS